ncbi:MAG: Rieske 2Fe-2S domain-containing protein [Burkholderiales bacterium]|nr:Rieske 2Fe-2S domain-containing protein [Rubrivivax sp.]MCZ2442057.1 Rieske 2Fe-2S domain-containing protein [Burkholderiales bacterium]
MNRDEQVALMRQAFAHLDAGTTDLADAVSFNPVTAYTCPQRLARESALLFRKYPLLMGLSNQIPQPGDHFTDDLSGIPILVVRGKDGRARAFHNVCRHRGARLAEGCGRQNNFVCPYHGWTYGLEGELRGIPDQRNFPGVDKAAYGLAPLPLAERHGMLWVQPSVGPEGLEIDAQGFLGELDAEFASFGLAGYHHYETRQIQRQMNWKLVIDTFLESYHFSVLHRDSVAPLFHPNLCLFKPFGLHLREVLPRRSLERQRGLPESEWDLIAHHTLVYVLFPNTVFVVQVDHVETWRVYPTAGKVDECTMYLDFHVPHPVDSDSARRHWQRNMDLTIRTVCDEDFPASEGMQRGFASGAQTHATYGRNEPALAYFQRTVAQAVGDTSPPGETA